MTEPTPLPGRGLQPLTSLLAHRWLALAAALLVLAVGVPMAWLKGAPRYQAEASLQVAPRVMRNLREDPELDFQSNTQYRQFVEHQRRSIGRFDVLQGALASLGPRRTLWQRPGESERHAVERLREQLQVANVPDTYLLRLSLDSGQPEGLADIVNAVTTTFIERMKAEQIFGADERTGHLRDRETVLLAQIERLGGQRAEIARGLSLTTFNEGTPNPYDRLMADLRARLADARARQLEADAALAAFKGRGDTQVSVRSVQDAVLNDPGLNSLKGALNTRRAALLGLKSGLRADHPGAQAADRELAEIDGEIGRQTGALEGGVRSNLQARLQGGTDQAQALVQGLQAELSALETQATGFARLFQQAMALTADLAQARAELDKVRERINSLGMESNSLGFVRLVAPALVPEQPFGPGRKKLLLGALLAALAAAVVAPLLRDALDRRVHTVNEAQRLVGIQPAGWQVQTDGSAGQVFGDEQLRRMAGALIRGRDARGSGLYGLTGCKPGAGTTGLVLALADTLQRLGYRVLAVEANGQHPDARFASPRPGLVDLLCGRTDDPAALVTEATATQVARVGLGSKGRSTLDRLDRLGLALDAWQASHDFVLVDLPPLLTSADAELLVRRVGQVMLVVEAGAVSRGEVQRAARLLQTLAPDAVGLLVNRIAPFTAGGYLRELMLESVSGRRSPHVLTTPPWRLWLAALTLRNRKSPA